MRHGEHRVVPLPATSLDEAISFLEDYEQSLPEEAYWVPRARSGKGFPDVPPHIGLAANEAYTCLDIGAHRGAVMLARAVIEATCKDKEITSGSLSSKIDKLADAGHIRANIKDAAHEVRHLGNDMAHGDFVDTVTAEEAEETLELMSIVLAEVYEQPAMIAKRRAARQAKGA